jgi:hypothetical protein
VNSSSINKLTPCNRNRRLCTLIPTPVTGQELPLSSSSNIQSLCHLISTSVFQEPSLIHVHFSAIRITCPAHSKLLVLAKATLGDLQFAIPSSFLCINAFLRPSHLGGGRVIIYVSSESKRPHFATKQSCSSYLPFAYFNILYFRK